MYIFIVSYTKKIYDWSRKWLFNHNYFKTFLSSILPHSFFNHLTFWNFSEKLRKRTLSRLPISAFTRIIYHGHLSTNRNGVNLYGVYNLRYVAFLLRNGISHLSLRHPCLVRRWVNDACLTSIEIHFTVERIANKLRAGFPLKFRFAPIIFGARGVFLWSEKKPYHFDSTEY